MSEKEKMLAGELYNPSDKTLVEMRLKARTLTKQLNTLPLNKIKEKREVIKQLFGSTGQHIEIEANFHCDYGCNIHVGENFYANASCVILDVVKVHIGDNCFLAPQVGIYTATHPLDVELRNSGLEFAKPISIGNNCWIGGHAVINPGVTLGNNVVVASGAVVTKSFADNVVIAGNPAKVIKQLPA